MGGNDYCYMLMLVEITCGYFSKISGMENRHLLVSKVMIYGDYERNIASFIYAYG